MTHLHLVYLFIAAHSTAALLYACSCSGCIIIPSLYLFSARRRTEHTDYDPQRTCTPDWGRTAYQFWQSTKRHAWLIYHVITTNPVYLTSILTCVQFACTPPPPPPRLLRSIFCYQAKLHFYFPNPFIWYSLSAGFIKITAGCWLRQLHSAHTRRLICIGV